MSQNSENVHDICTQHLPSTRAEELKRAQLKVEYGVRLSLEARWREKEEEENTRLEDGEDARLVEEARLKAEEEEQVRLISDEETRLAKEEMQKAE